MKAVVSGADGNLGKHICRHFPGEIYKLGRTGWCDDFSGADVFIHCAYDLQSSYLSDPEKVLDSNVTSVGLALKMSRRMDPI